MAEIIDLQDLTDGISIPLESKEKLETYHLSVDQKLWSAKFFFGFLISLDPKQLIPDMETLALMKVSGSTESTTSQTSENLIPKEALEKFNYESNMCFDGLVTSLKSALDSLAHEINAIFPTNLQKIYLNEDFIKKIRTYFSKRKIQPHLENLLIQKWFQDLQDYRNKTTHERLVKQNLKVITSTSIDPQKGSFEEKVEEVKRYLPDDISSFPLKYSYLTDQELESACFQLKKSVNDFIKKSYKLIRLDMEEVKVLPIIKYR